MERKFRVGDKVRIKTSQSACSADDVGRVGEVTKVNENCVFYPYSVSGSPYGWCDEELELVVEPRFKVGDRVVLTPKGVEYFARPEWRRAASTSTEGIVLAYYASSSPDAQNVTVRFATIPFAHGDEGDYWYMREPEIAPAPVYVPRHIFDKPTTADAVSAETLDRWVDEGTKNYDAQRTLGYENPSYTVASGDTLLRIENGKAYLYRLEGVKNVE